MANRLIFLGCNELWGVDLTVGKKYEQFMWCGAMNILDDIGHHIVLVKDRLKHFEEVK